MWEKIHIFFIICSFSTVICSEEQDTIQEVEACTVCLDPITTFSHSAHGILSSDHYFNCPHFSQIHYTCAEEWQRAQYTSNQISSCPVCRAQLSMLTIKPISLPIETMADQQSNAVKLHEHIPLSIISLPSGAIVVTGKKKVKKSTCFFSKEAWYPFAISYKNNILDQTFGTQQSGIVIMPNQTEKPESYNPRNKEMPSVSWGNDIFIGCNVGHKKPHQNYGIIYGYNENGHPIHTFGHKGKIKCDQITSVNALVVSEKTNQLFAAGVSRNTYDQKFHILSFNQHGVLLHLFGKLGILALPMSKGCSVHNLSLMGKNKCTIVGKNIDALTSDSTIVAASFFLNGKLNEDWGDKGIAQLPIHTVNENGEMTMCDVSGIQCVSTGDEELFISATSHNPFINASVIVAIHYDKKGNNTASQSTFFNKAGTTDEDNTYTENYNCSLLIDSKKRLLLFGNHYYKNRPIALLMARYKQFVDRPFSLDTQEAFKENGRKIYDKGKIMIDNENEKNGILIMNSVCLKNDDSIVITGMKHHSSIELPQFFVAHLNTQNSLSLFKQ